jgi:formylglycine-generating enzyme
LFFDLSKRFLEEKMKAIKRKFNWFALCMLVIMVFSACVPNAKSTSPEETATPEPLAEDQKYVLVSGSKFLMGSEKGAPLSREDEYPQHEVILPSFFIMKREVTNAEYRSCMDAGVCTAPLQEEEGPTSFFMDPNFNHWPVVGVDWFQAQMFCEWTDARLPSEAEWEKAARGRAGDTFPWGDEPPNCDLANSVDCQEETNTVRVLSYPQGESPYKLTETAGNVSEWTADWYMPDYYTEQVTFAPYGPGDGELKVTRGGAWTDGPENLRAAARMPMDPLEQNENLGFRCVPVGKAVAPVCQKTYRNFCEDPRVPGKPGDEPCIPEEESGDCGGTAIASFGCPDDDLVTVTFAVPAEGEVNVNIGTAGFDCEAGDGVMYCTGPAPKMGSEVTVTVCGAPPPPEAETEPVTAEMNISSIVLARILNPVLVSLAEQEKLQHFGFCPDGYEMDTDSGDCVKLEVRQPCPEGWSPDTQVDVDTDEEVLICVPDGPESCPENSEYDPASKECRLLDLGVNCPVGFETNLEKETCSPPTRRLTSCLPGYWMDREMDCCVPMENPCEAGEYIETRIDECLESGPGGCPACTYLDEYEGCIPIPDCEPGGENDGDPAADTGPTERTNLAQLPEGMGALQPDCLPDHTDE